MFYSQFKQLLIKGMIRVEGRPDGIFIISQNRKHRFLSVFLSRMDKLNLAGFAVTLRRQAEQESNVSPKVSGQVLNIVQKANITSRQSSDMATVKRVANGQ